MNEIRKAVLRCVAVLLFASLSGCAAILDHFEWREHRRSAGYATRLILSQHPELRGTHFDCLKSQWKGGGRLERAPYYYAIVRYADDPDSRYRIFVVEQRIASPGARPVITLRPGYARDYWHRLDPGVRERRHVILSPKSYQPAP